MAVFQFKDFAVDDHGCGMKISTDSVLLGSWARLPSSGLIADLGTGSGVLALMCCRRSPLAQVEAVEIDPKASEACRANADASPWPHRITTVCASALDFKPSAPVDLAISNPPYFTTGMLSPDAARAGARHAIGFGPEATVDIAARILAPAGSLAIITPADCRATLLAHAEYRRLKLRRICSVYTVEGKAPTRILWQFSRIDGDIERQSLCIRLRTGLYSPEYITLTKEFYLNF